MQNRHNPNVHVAFSPHFALYKRTGACKRVLGFSGLSVPTSVLDDEPLRHRCRCDGYTT